jgi:malate/lactate dehydrogenase
MRKKITLIGAGQIGGTLAHLNCTKRTWRCSFI